MCPAITTKKGMVIFKLNFVLFVTGLLVAVMVGNAQSTKRLQPGKLYNSGEKIYAPRYGFTSVVPERWEGTLPRDMEIFLLLPDTNTFGGEIFTFASEKNNLDALRETWLKGVSLSETIGIKAKDINVSGDMMSTELAPDGKSVDTGNRGYAAARCSPFNLCITCVAIGPTQFYEEMKTAVESFMANASFTAPSNVSIYADFNWKEFLSDKTLITLLGIEGQSDSGTKESVFDLCSDGTFKGDIKKKGAMKEVNSSYKGNQSGTWHTESVGENGVLVLNFEKLPAVELTLNIKDERITVNGERYFVAESEKCKKR
jgi:hypothetical protein